MIKVGQPLDLPFSKVLTFRIGKTMQIFIKTEGYELWNIITKGPYVPMTTVDGKTVKKAEEQYTQENFARLSKNCKVMHILYCGLDANEYNRCLLYTSPSPRD